MKYICLVYPDEKSLQELSPAGLAEHVGECGAWVGELEASGRHIYSAGLQSPRAAATVRRRAGSTVVSDGPYAETKEYLGGFTILEARDLNEAIQLASKLDAARLGAVEVRPLMSLDADLADPFDQKLATAIRHNNEMHGIMEEQPVPAGGQAGR